MTAALCNHPAAIVKSTKRKASPQPNPYAVCQVRGGDYGYVLINAVKISDCTPHVCPNCRMIAYQSGRKMPVAYAHKMTSAEHCDECESDRIALRGIELEKQGIELGWGVYDHSREYEREAHHWPLGKG